MKLPGLKGVIGPKKVEVSNASALAKNELKIEKI